LSHPITLVLLIKITDDTYVKYIQLSQYDMEYWSFMCAKKLISSKLKTTTYNSKKGMKQIQLKMKTKN